MVAGIRYSTSGRSLPPQGREYRHLDLQLQAWLILSVRAKRQPAEELALRVQAEVGDVLRAFNRKNELSKYPMWEMPI